MPDAINPWNGKPIRDLENPVLSAINAFSPVKISDPQEPWEEFLRDINYTGIHMLRYDSSGSYEWEPEDREIIYKYVGEQRLDKQVMRIMKNKAYKKLIKSTVALRGNYRPDKDTIKLKTDLSPLHRDLDQMVREALKIAEQRYLVDKPLIQQAIFNAQLAKQAMREGRVDQASQLQKKDAELKNLIEHGN